MKLQRYADNPILSANPDNDWESLCVCNPAVWYEDGMFTMLYRAAGGDEAHRIHLGLATSADGFHFERQDSRPVLSPTPGNYDGGCVEDPRVVKLNGTFYVTYACRPYPPGRYWEFPHQPASLSRRRDLGIRGQPDFYRPGGHPGFPCLSEDGPDDPGGHG